MLSTTDKHLPFETVQYKVELPDNSDTIAWGNELSENSPDPDLNDHLPEPIFAGTAFNCVVYLKSSSSSGPASETCGCSKKVISTSSASTQFQLLSVHVNSFLPKDPAVTFVVSFSGFSKVTPLAD